MLRRLNRSNNQIHEEESLPKRILLRGMIVCALFVLGGYLFFVNTQWGQMVDNAAYAGRKVISPALIEYDHAILNAVSVSTLVVAIVLILIMGALRRRLIAAAIIAVGFALAVAGGEFLKHRLPWHALVTNDNQLPLDLQGPTYPSGHTTIGTAFAIALILISSTKLRPSMTVLAGLLSASFATGVLFVGWHRPSDALGGIFWAGFCMSLTALSAIGLRGKTIRRLQRAGGTFPSSLLLIVIAGMALLLWFTTTKIDATQVIAQIPFLVLSFLIMISSFGVALWFGWQLRSVDWVEHT